MRNPLGVVLFVCLLTFTSCDPGHFGDMFVRNTSAQALRLNYSSNRADGSMVIPPDTLVHIYHFGSLGAGENYDCCSCEFLSVALAPVDTTLLLTKDPLDRHNWELTNPNTWRFSSKTITCEFVVTDADITPK